MPIIDAKKLNREITSKYSIVSNAFRLVNDKSEGLDAKGTPKDLITTEVGDTKQAEFFPQVKLCRWGDSENDNEVNFSVRLIDTEYEKATVTTEGDKIVWDKDNVKIEMYDFAEGDGGYKFVWYLKEKPLTNRVEFSIQSKNLDFFYQPELTQQEIDDGAFRPPEIIGSYAVYHQTKGGMNDSAGKEYKTGQAFMIYRPHIIDASGAETWGNLHIENGIYSVEIPQDFLDNAVYPIKSNDTFGYTTIGSSSVTSADDNSSWFAKGTPAGGNGTVSKISTYVKSAFSTSPIIKGVIWLVSDSSIISGGIGGTFNVTSVAGWRDTTYSSPPSVVNGTAYYVGVVNNTYYTVRYYNTGSSGDGGNEGAGGNNYTTPEAIGTINNPTRLYSTYATYTASGGSAIKTINGLAIASVKTVNGLAIASVKTWNGLA